MKGLLNPVKKNLIIIHRQLNFTKTLIPKDTEERYVLVNGIEISLINFYTPNEDKPGFIRPLFNMVLKYSTGLLLMGGDFNCIMLQLINKKSKMLQYPSVEVDLVDVWCPCKCPTSRDFTFYPKVRIVDIEILPITISAPVSLK